MRLDIKALWFALSYSVFVVYGSLVPLDYQALPWGEALRRFASVPYLDIGAGGRADWIANAVLYVPLGLLATRALIPALFGSVWLAGAVAVLGCSALAIGVEFTQLYFPPRTVSQNDILAEAIGSVLGVALAARLGAWMRRLSHAWTSRGERVFLLSLQAYALVYLALSFFPYDLLLSSAELQGKLASALWGWWLAASDRGAGLVWVQLGVEVMLCMPLGLLLARHRGRAWSGWARPVTLGLLLGLVIELGQFTIVSGLSQGASVLTRGLGVGAGAWLAPKLLVLTPEVLRATLRRATLPMLVLWLPLLLFVNGWFRVPWQGRDAALATWRELNLLPFYYHYFTTEAVALFSLGSVALMYLPWALLAWARQWPTWSVALSAAGLVLMVETAKLFLRGMHPDPTNLLIVVAACTGLLWMLQRWTRPAVVLTQEPIAALAPRRAGVVVTLPLLVALGALVVAARYPVAAAALCLGLIAAAMLVAWRPVLALAIVSLAMPVLDLAPWSGSLFFDEFDLLLMVCVGVAWARTAPPASRPWDGGRIAFTLVAAALLISTLRALLPWPGWDAGSFSSLATPFVALRIVKGAVWAWLFVALWARLQLVDDGQDMRERMFTAGACMGLLVTLVWLLWERWAYGVLADFSSDLRATGPFSAMSKGGAYIECYLVVACAFVLGELLRDGVRPAWRVGLLALLAAGVLGVMLTFSRNGYVGLAALAAVMALGLWRSRANRRLWWAALALVGVVAVVVPMALTPFASSRLAESARDLQVRQAHWADALVMRSPDWASRIFGEGLGQFPERHYWRSQEAIRAGSYRLVQEPGQRFLRLGSGATLYIEQVLPALPRQALVLEARIRSAAGPAQVAVSLCEKSMLTSHSCHSATLASPAGTAANTWQAVRISIDIPGAGLQSRLPLKLSLLTPGSGPSVDITDVRLTTRDGVPLVHNGDFAEGMDRWFFSTDVDPPWHIHNLALTWLFDQGWFGLAAWAALVGWALVAGVARADGHGPSAWAPLAALAAFLTCGTLNTLVDEPRFLWLLLLLVWLAGRGAYVSQRAPQSISARSLIEARAATGP